MGKHFLIALSSEPSKRGLSVWNGLKSAGKCLGSICVNQIDNQLNILKNTISSVTNPIMARAGKMLRQRVHKCNQ